MELICGRAWGGSVPGDSRGQREALSGPVGPRVKDRPPFLSLEGRGHWLGRGAAAGLGGQDQCGPGGGDGGPSGTGWGTGGVGGEGGQGCLPGVKGAVRCRLPAPPTAEPPTAEVIAHSLSDYIVI